MQLTRAGEDVAVCRVGTAAVGVGGVGLGLLEAGGCGWLNEETEEEENDDEEDEA